MACLKFLNYQNVGSILLGEIDWGDIESAPVETHEIDFNIEEVETAGITVEDDGIEGGVARNEEALSILENSQTREEFINELVEVSC